MRKKNPGTNKIFSKDYRKVAVMLQRLIRHRALYIFGLGLMLVSLPLSNFFMSVSQFVLIGKWLLEGRIKEKLHSFFSNRVALILCSVYLLHLIGLFYTSDFAYAIKDLRIKLPLLVLPLVLATMEKLSEKEFRGLLLLFCTAVIASSFYSTYLAFFSDFDDIRQISPLISHIRLSLNTCFAIFILGYFLVVKNAIPLYLKIIAGVAAIWMVTFLFILESFTGIAVLFLTICALLIYFAFIVRQPALKLVSLLTLIAFPFAAYLYIRNIVNDYYNIEPVNFSQLESYTPRGNLYYHDTLSSQVVNGHYLWLYVSEEEMREEWNKRSAYDFDSMGTKGQSISDILTRFLTSKGLRKDADGVQSLSDKEIQMVESGIPNVTYKTFSAVKDRVYKFLWEYENYKSTGDPSGHSIMQRLEYWKASLHLIGKNLLCGVGTGDTQDVFDTYYKETNSVLAPQWRLRSHNQFLAIGVAFGLIGMVWFIIAFFYPAFYLRRFSDYFYFVFLTIAFLSMLTEDTIETQAGVSFYAFFNCLFLFATKKHMLKSK